MASLFTLTFLASSIAFMVGLLNPRWVVPRGKKTRGRSSLIYGGILLLSFIGVGVASPSPPEETTVAPTPSALPPSSKPSPSPSPTPPASPPSPKPSPSAEKNVKPSQVPSKTAKEKPSPQKTETVKKAEPVTQAPKRRVVRVVKEKPAEAPPKKSQKGSSSGAKCSDFATQLEAKAALSANPQLDKDKDGIPCESLPKS